LDLWLTRISHETVVNYLSIGGKILLEEYSIHEIIEISKDRNIALHVAAIDFQRDILEYNYQIKRNFGCQYLAMLPRTHESDEELVELPKEFMLTAMKSYVACLKRQYSERGFINRTIPMTKTDILEFFEGCNALSTSNLQPLYLIFLNVIF
jgi:hypothetical protein